MATYWNLIGVYNVLSGLINQEVLFLENDIGGPRIYTESTLNRKRK